ncbi:hypothetical protein [Streptomyces sp. NPDC018693]|uniref:hypothetical protein n=1 Tax=unclassified Streptomyces TaxID=2593676 RepID=UPI0037BC4612
MTSVHPAVERADALIDLERYDEVKALLVKRLAEDPEDIRALIGLALCLRKGDEDKDGALEAAERAISLDPEHIGARIEHACALQFGGRIVDAEDDLREVIRLAPDYWYGYALLGHWLWRIRGIRYGREHGLVDREAMRAHLQESAELVREAMRLAPEKAFPYEAMRSIADMQGDKSLTDDMDRAILRLDPSNQQALTRQTQKAADAPGVRAREAATLYADALAVAPDSAAMQRGLDDASYRLLRGLRWPALFCLLFAAVGIDLFPVEGEAQRALPLPLGQRLWDLVPMTAIWVVSALLVYRRLRTGIQLNLRSVVRRRVWPRIVLVQAAWTMLCALLVVEVPWTDRTVPQVLFWVGLLSSLATMRFDRDRTD